MRLVLSALIGLLVVAHLAFFILEAVLWESTDPRIARIRVERLGFREDSQAEVAKVGKNQGLCNGFLAAGLVWGLWGFRRGRPEGRPVLNFFLGFIALAGLVGWWSIQPPALIGTLAFLVGQTGLAVAAMCCLRTVPVREWVS